VPTRAFQPPDVLVLAAGGILGEAWMTGVLAGIEAEAGVDFRRCEHFVGTSAGSLVAAGLVAGVSPRRPARASALAASAPEAAEGEDGIAQSLARTAARWTWMASMPLAPAALAVGAPAGARIRSALLARSPSRGRDLSRDVRAGLPPARFDGRLRVVCVERETGRRVVFGAPGAPDATVADAVAASCSIPWVFRPVPIGGREYVDGGVWSLTNLDVAPAGRDTEVLCLNPTASLTMTLGSPFAVLRAAARGAEAVETLALRRRGARVRTIGPDRESGDLMRGDLMDRGPAARVLSSGYRQGLAIGAGG
jgi:NTE family protein